ncbi:peptidase M14 [Lysobacter sp. TY2-98]|uniref:M14 family metallopeptidase n=1 Tax=Lysobacter sp. TY2-98 TaxID=2290922 RepID=UPI000E2026EA|nr:M14 family metallopeptidase [Lysobacter sp. TY2-98]AXK72048.1 peptidase M14 [Lysobacter sp. TY2-98]
MNRTPLLVALLAVALPVFAQDALTTVAERSGFVRTGRYDEVIALCDAFAAKYPNAVRCETFGTTPEGRPMKALIASTSGALTPEAARAKNLPVTLMQGGIHAGEIDGKDAGFLALREMLDGKLAKGVLDRQVFVFVPVFNIDGHERFKAWNRPNQRGPEEMGWRATAQNLNLNRDYMKADAPEMRAMLALIERWDPVAYVDLHVTDGAKFQHDVAVQVEPVNSGDEKLRVAGRALRHGTIDRLTRQGALPLPFYPSFVKGDDPSSGFEDGVSTPRFSLGYMQLRNRMAMLVETHSWRPYAYRVNTTHNAIIAVLEQVAANGVAWQRLEREADDRATKLAGTSVPLDYKATEAARTIDFKGYAYTRTPSTVSGALMTRYDESKPQIWRIPLHDVVVPRISANAPRAGYVVPAAWIDMVKPTLDAHRIRYTRLDAPLDNIAAQSWRASTIKFSSDSFEGHQRLDAQGTWTPETRSLVAGALFVPIAQPKARLVMGLLEPTAPDAIAAWGRTNTAFERKEYMEDYVAEEEAEKMLAADPALRAEFDKRLKDDPDFAKSPEQRLEFFYRRHSAWDERYGLYPVLRVDTAPR